MARKVKVWRYRLTNSRAGAARKPHWRSHFASRQLAHPAREQETALQHRGPDTTTPVSRQHGMPAHERGLDCASSNEEGKSIQAVSRVSRVRTVEARTSAFAAQKAPRPRCSSAQVLPDRIQRLLSCRATTARWTPHNHRSQTCHLDPVLLCSPAARPSPWAPNRRDGATPRPTIHNGPAEPQTTD